MGMGKKYGRQLKTFVRGLYLELIELSGQVGCGLEEKLLLSGRIDHSDGRSASLRFATFPARKAVRRITSNLRIPGILSYTKYEYIGIIVLRCSGGGGKQHAK